MNDIYLKTNLKVIAPYLGKTKFDFWYKLTPGIIFEVKTDMKMWQSYANDMILTIKSGPDSGESFKVTNGNFQNYLRKMEVEEYV